jgi:predicted nucleic acid-binding protein
VIVCDTGPIVAAALIDDDRHHECVELFTGLHLATVIALAERPNVTEIATLDRRHFTGVRPSHISSLTLLP